MPGDKPSLVAHLRSRLSRISIGRQAPLHSNSPLPDEVVRAICLHARVSVYDIAQDGRRLTGRDMAQPELAVLMRVSKQFYNIAAPILYTHIITPDLPFLLHDMLTSTSHLGLVRRPKLSPSRAWLLSHCRHLSLESCEMIKPGTPRFTSIQIAVHKQKPYLKSQGPGPVYREYVERVTPQLKAINTYGGLAWLLPNLQTLSVCAHGTVYDHERGYRFSNGTAWGLLEEAEEVIRSARVKVRCYGTHTAWPYAWAAGYRISSRTMRGDEGVVQYVHTTKGDSYRVHYRSKTVYLYHDTSSTNTNTGTSAGTGTTKGRGHGCRMSQYDLETLLDRLIDGVKCTRVGTDYTPGDNPVDIEIRIPRAFCPEWRDHALLDYDEMAKIALRRRLDASQSVYIDPRVWRDPADKWEIVITPGVQYCPACAQPYGLAEDDRSSIVPSWTDEIDEMDELPQYD